MGIGAVGVKAVDGQKGANAVNVPTWVFKPVTDDTRANKLSNQGLALLKSGDNRGALRLFEQALALPLEKGTDRPALLNRMGVAYNRLGDQAKAIAQFDRASDGGKYPPATYNKAVSTLKAAIADSGQWDAFTKDKGSIDVSKLDKTEVKLAVALLAEAVDANGEFFTKMARADTDWAPLMKLPELRELIGLERLPGTTGASATSAFANGTLQQPPAQDAAKRAEEQKSYARSQKGLGFETS